jgi:tetratricopeptide (TPR) repeat protein
MATIAEALQTAVKFHQDGNLAEAERIYREILKVQPRQADAWHLLGLVAHNRGQCSQALEYIRRAIQLNGAEASYHNHLGEVYRSLGNASDAEICCRQALRLKPDWAVAHNTLGLVLGEQGKSEAAIASFRRALEHQPDLAQAHCNLGSALQASGQLDEAIACYRRALDGKPDYAIACNLLGTALSDQGQFDVAAEAFRRAMLLDPGCAPAENNLGLLFQSQSDWAEAAAAYRRALAIQPDFVEAHFNLAGALDQLGQTAEAAACYQRALQLQPNLAEAHFNLGVILQAQGQLAAAAECYRETIRVQPEHGQAHSNLGTVYRAENRLAEAIECYQRALEVRPDFVETLSNLGNVFKLQGRMAEARICYDQSLRLKPDHAQARYNRSSLLLAAGEWEHGWADYESRWQCDDFPKRPFAKPVWKGEPLQKRVLLVHAEQGLGDTLHFARYVKRIGSPAGKVLFEVPPLLVRLFEQSDFRNLVVQGAPLPDFDVYVPLMSLPGILGTTLENIPAEVPYLSADPALVDVWRDQIGAKPGFKVGIAWQGKTTYKDDRFRSIPLARFGPLAQEGVELISLQKGPGAEQLAELEGRFHVTDFPSSFDHQHGPFMDTAAVMKNLDLVITTDTAIAHLAGALAVPVWVALSISPDWRWLLEREDSPWYPTMRLFRQTSFDEWQPVFERIAGELARAAARSG